MARQVTVLSVFVASPSDVEEERNCLEDVIRELNLQWRNNGGIQLELVKWETHAYPDFSSDPQSVINEQIPHDYDIFIGIMWCTAGSPTGRADSGTIEEFQRAKTRHDTTPDSVRLLFYFKDAPISPSQIDPNQIQKVTNFRKNLGEEGGLYWIFKTAEEFATNVRLHLTRHVEDWRRQKDGNFAVDRRGIDIDDSQQRASVSDRSIGVDRDEVDYEDEPGLLDLEEEVESEFSELQEVTERISAATKEIGELVSCNRFL